MWTISLQKEKKGGRWWKGKRDKGNLPWVNTAACCCHLKPVINHSPGLFLVTTTRTCCALKVVGQFIKHDSHWWRSKPSCQKNKPFGLLRVCNFYSQCSIRRDQYRCHKARHRLSGWVCVSLWASHVCVCTLHASLNTQLQLSNMQSQWSFFSSCYDWPLQSCLASESGHFCSLSIVLLKIGY